TPLYTATFSTRGARLTSFKLKKYLTTMGSDAQGVEILRTPMPTLLLNRGSSDEGFMYESSTQGTMVIGNTPGAIEFRTTPSTGITLKKIYTIDPQTYLLGYRTVIENHTTAPMAVSGEIIFNNSYPLDKKMEGYAFQGPVLVNGKHLEEFKIDKVKKIGTYREFTGDVQWFGFEDKYFLQAIISKAASSTTLTIKRIDEKLVELHYALTPATVQAGSSLSRDNLIFMGPKELKILKAAGYNLNKALDFGFFDIIAKPLLISMNWIFRYTMSYGWTIIILTVIIKILLYPLTLKSFTSMKELQKIQPLMKEIQQQYKDDKQKMNQELMRLYQEHKINPMGGCLPMLLQIPILFALYKVFYQAIELRHTPFHIVGSWLPDLSAADPYYITPILMGASQFVMQKMTPTAGDPMQQKIMLFMPVLFTFLFLNFPSGLVIYWLISNILSIVQQAYINRKHT
ncbi:MAG TPA: membrane protein insertase YidC, partial [Desulfomonilia bacterium]|nr:membrane protein insertase YidC [Desulfomonilia bacterium]